MAFRFSYAMMLSVMSVKYEANAEANAEANVEANEANREANDANCIDNGP